MLLASLLNLRIEIHHIPGKLNPGDPFSRPEQQDKQREATIIAQHVESSQQALCWPPSLRFRATTWGDVVRLAREHHTTPTESETVKRLYESAVSLRPTGSPEIAKLVSAVWSMPRYI